MGKTVTSRLPEDMVESINEISDIERLDRSSTIRRLLDDGIKHWKEERAISLFQNEEISLGKAAEMCGLTIWDFLSKIAKKKIPIHYDIEDFEEDLKTVDSL